MLSLRQIKDPMVSPIERVRRGDVAKERHKRDQLAHTANTAEHRQRTGRGQSKGERKSSS